MDQDSKSQAIANDTNGSNDNHKITTNDCSEQVCVIVATILIAQTLFGLWFSRKLQQHNRVTWFYYWLTSNIFFSQCFATAQADLIIALFNKNEKEMNFTI